MSSFQVLLRTPWQGPWRHFTGPVTVLEARGPGDVRDCLAAVQRAVKAHQYHAAGFVTYEAAAAFGLQTQACAGLPLVCFGLFPARHVRSLQQIPAAGTPRIAGWRRSVEWPAYREAVARIRDRIEAGDTYQINYTFRVHGQIDGEPIDVFADLYAAQRGPWAAYVDLGSHAICSASPELFFLRDGGMVTCRPMKGTAPRGLTLAADDRQAAWLRESEKNRAENVMIVDMTRNDLGRIARIGSVRVASLFDVERYPGHWQMTSTVEAAIPDLGLQEMFEALYPSGSVTGAPKISAMRILADLETRPRGAYTGSIGCLSPDGRAHFNIAIRTATIDRARRTIECGVGSGIVWDSVDREEYEECALKASVFCRRQEPFQLLETLRWDPNAGFALLDGHLRRMRDSAEYFSFSWDRERALDALRAAVDGHVGSAARVRLLLSVTGVFRAETERLRPAPPGPLRSQLAAESVDRHSPFLYHKTTRRDFYRRAEASRPEAEAVLLWNDLGQITETTEANVVMEIEGCLVTPPAACGLLPGTLRAQLLGEGTIRERPIRGEELRAGARYWIINSVRGWREAVLMDGS